MGTQTGLDRFDGINVKSFLQFSGRTIFSIAETDSVYLWVGTDKGLWRLDRKTDQVKLVTLDTKSLEVRSVFVSQTGRLLVGTTHGLFIYQENTFRKVLFGSNALSSTNFLTGIVEGHKDTFWLTSQGGLIEYNIVTGQSEVYTYQGDERFVNYFSCLTLLKENNGVINYNTYEKIHLILFVVLPVSGRLGKRLCPSRHFAFVGSFEAYCWLGEK